MVEANWQDLEAIKRLKYKYQRCLDTKEWKALRDCFTEDAKAAYSSGKFSFDGRDAILRFLEGAMGADSFHSSHVVSQPEIDFVDERTATGRWCLQDYVIDTSFDMIIHGAAFYEDEYRKGDDGAWRITKTGYTRTYEQMVPRKSIEGLTLTDSRWQSKGK
jgi:ketosteroid isomerase-like protein